LRSPSGARSASTRGLGDDARIVLAAILFRLFSALAAFLANVTIPQYQDQGFSVFRTDNLFWDAFARYDAGWYHGIASQGYTFGAGGRNNLAFFPIYPMLMRAGGWALGGRQQDFYFAGIVVSWLAFAGRGDVSPRAPRSRPSAFRALMYAAVSLHYSSGWYIPGITTTLPRHTVWVAGALGDRGDYNA
jgi:hypothetical protein